MSSTTKITISKQNVDFSTTETGIERRASDKTSGADVLFHNTAKRFLSYWDGSSSQHLNTVPVVSSDPISASNNDLWINSTDNNIKYHVSGSTIALGTGSGAASGAGYTQLVASTDFDTTASNSNVINMNTDQTSLIIPGTALRYVSEGTTQYGIVKSISVSQIFIYGPPLSTSTGQVSAIAYGTADKVAQADLFLSGKFSQSLSPDILVERNKARFTWQGPRARLVHIDVTAKTGVLQDDNYILAFDADFASGHTFNASVNGEVVASAFNGSHSQTINDVATDLAATDYIASTSYYSNSRTVHLFYESQIYGTISASVAGSAAPNMSTSHTQKQGPSVNVTLAKHAILESPFTGFSTSADVFTDNIKAVGSLLSEDTSCSSAYGTTNIDRITDFNTADYDTSSRSWSDGDIYFQCDLGSEQFIKNITLTTTDMPVNNDAGFVFDGSTATSPGSSDWFQITEKEDNVDAGDTFYLSANVKVRHLRMRHRSTGASASDKLSVTDMLVYGRDNTVSEVNIDPNNYTINPKDGVFVRTGRLGTADDTNATISLVFVGE